MQRLRLCPVLCYAVRVMVWVCKHQWRRQTIKSGSAFKGQLYFKVGHMEGSKVRKTREARSIGARGGGEWGVAPPIPPKFQKKSTFKLRIFCIFAN